MPLLDLRAKKSLSAFSEGSVNRLGLQGVKY